MKKLILILLAQSITCFGQGVIEPEMILVQGGTFNMGGTEKNEKPVHSVALANYYIGKYEVNQKEWTSIMGYNPSNFKGDKLPVDNISFEECQKFLKKLSTKTKKQYRLPTEAEWEFAARGGNNSKGYTYSGGNTLEDVGWFYGNALNETCSTGQKRANELGIYDMCGNVWEWCNDVYGNYDSKPVKNPQGAKKGSDRVYRGGSWSSIENICRVAYRFSDSPTYKDNDLGFRVVRVP